MAFNPLPDNEIELPNVPPTDWQDYVDACKYLAKKVTPNARIHAFWNMEKEIGATLQLLRSKADGGKVNGLILGISAATPTPPEQQKVGGCQFDWLLTIDWWRFLGYENGSDSANQFRRMYKECRDYGVIIYKNQLRLGMQNPTMLKRVGMLDFPSIDLHGFPEGETLIAQGTLQITLREQL